MLSKPLQKLIEKHQEREFSIFQDKIFIELIAPLRKKHILWYQWQEFLG